MIDVHAGLAAEEVELAVANATGVVGALESLKRHFFPGHCVHVEEMEIAKAVSADSAAAMNENVVLVDAHEVIGPRLRFDPIGLDLSPGFGLEIEGVEIVEVVAVVASEEVELLLVDDSSVAPPAARTLALLVDDGPIHIQINYIR